MSWQAHYSNAVLPTRRRYQAEVTFELLQLRRRMIQQHQGTGGVRFGVVVSWPAKDQQRVIVENSSASLSQSLPLRWRSSG